MANTGNVFPSTCENVSRTGSPTPSVWATPSDAVSDNTLDATCNGSASSGSQYLVARNFGLALPGATIGGITVRIEASETGSGTETVSVRLQDDTGTLVGSTKTFVASGTGKTVYTLGSTSDLWGATLTQAIVNNANFGVRIWFTTTHSVQVDYFTLAVEYVATAITAALTGITPVSGSAGTVVAFVGTVPETGPFPPGVFPPEIFPGPIFPGAGAPVGDLTLELTGVVVNAAAGVPATGFGYSQALTGVASYVGSGTTEGGGIFPPGIFPPGVFPDPIFPGSGSGAAFLGGVGIVVPATLVVPPGVVVNGTVSFVAAGGDKVANLTGVVVNVSAGLLAVGNRDKALNGAVANAVAGTPAKAPSVLLAGVSVNVAVQTLVSTRTLAAPLAGAVANAGAGQPGIFDIFPLSGAVVTASAGFSTGGADKVASLTGVAVNAAAGSVMTALVGVQATASAGTLVQSQALILPGAVANAAAGNLVSDKSRVLAGVAVNAAAGSLQLAQGLTGVGITATAGALSNDRAAFTLKPPSLASAGFVGVGIPSDVTVALTGVSANAAAGSVAVIERNLIGVSANATAGTVVAIGDRDATLTGVAVNAIAYFLATGNDKFLAIGTVAGFAAGSVLEILRGSTLNGTGVDSTAASGTVSAGTDKNSQLVGVGVTAAAGYLYRESLALTGVGVTVRAGSTVQNGSLKTLASVNANASAGFITKAGDVIVSLVGVNAVASAGIVGVGPPITFGTDRHTGTRPARKTLKDLERLDREMALMEE